MLKAIATLLLITEMKIIPDKKILEIELEYLSQKKKLQLEMEKIITILPIS